MEEGQNQERELGKSYSPPPRGHLYCTAARGNSSFPLNQGNLPQFLLLTPFWQGERVGRVAHCLLSSGKTAIQRSCSQQLRFWYQQLLPCVLQDGTTPALTASWSSSLSASQLKKVQGRKVPLWDLDSILPDNIEVLFPERMTLCFQREEPERKKFSYQLNCSI